MKPKAIRLLGGNRPKEWGLSGIVPVPKKGNLTIPDNYRDISLTQVAAKVYNQLLLNIHNRRLALAGHVMRYDEMAKEVLPWQPDDKRRICRPSLTIKSIVKEDSGLHGVDLSTAMPDRDIWFGFN